MSLTHQIKGDKLYQIFNYNKRNKDTKLLFDSRYLIYDKFERRLINLSLSATGILDFSIRKNIFDEGKIVLEYNIIDHSRFDKYLLKDQIFKVVDYVPPYPGCDFCLHKKELDDTFFHCCYKDKTMTKSIKNCKYFRQKQIY